MRTVESHLLEDKMDEAVTHYINSHHTNEPIHIESNGVPMTVQDDGSGRVTITHQQTYNSQMYRQVSITEQVGEGPWGEELLEGPIAAIVAHLQNSRQHPPPHHKVSQVRSDVDTSVILDGSIRFNAQSLEQQTEPLVVQLPPMQTLPPLQDMKRCADTDWFGDKNKKDDQLMLRESEGQVLELASSSPAQHKQQNRKSLPHKKRISRKLKRNNVNTTPQQEQLVVINCSEAVSVPEQEQILPDNYVTVPHATHMSHEVRPVFICQECGEYYGEDQLKFYHHLKTHYEPQHTIIIENPVPDLPMDKMSTNCIVDNVATLPDSIVELSLENTVPKTLYQPIDKHILYTSSDKTLSYNNHKVQYSMASMESAVNAVGTAEQADKTDLYGSLDKVEVFHCGKCSKTFRKQRHCEAHMRDAHAINTKLEEMGEFSEPEDLMSGINVCVTDAEYELPLPHLTVDNGHIHQEHTRSWYRRNPPHSAAPLPAAGGTSGCTGYCGVCARDPDTPYKLLKEEVLQRIFDNEVSDNANFADNMLPDHEVNDPDLDDPHHTDHDTHSNHHHTDHETHSNHHTDHNGHSDHSQAHSENDHGHIEQNHRHNETHIHNTHHTHSDLHIDSIRQSAHSQIQRHNKNIQNETINNQGKIDENIRHNDNNQEQNERSHNQNEHSQSHIEHSQSHSEHSQGHVEHSQEHSDYSQDPLNYEQQNQTNTKSKQPHSCPKCERVFVHRNSLLYHLLSHGRKQHICKECGKEFYTHGALKIHRRQHNNERPYNCEICGRGFRQYSDMKYHVNSIHSDKKPFKCEFCGKEFARKYSLSLHVRIHTGEKNFKCDFCSKSFSCSSYRLAHMKTHTGARPYKCDECDKSFRSGFDLRRHLHIHYKERSTFDEHKPKTKDNKNKIKMTDTKEEKEENFEPSPKKIKQVAIASTARQAVVLKKQQKPKKSNKKGAPNVTVQNFTNNVEVYDGKGEYAKIKHIYSEKIPLVFKEDQSHQRDLAVLRPIVVHRAETVEEKTPYRAENTDGKMQVFTHVEKDKDYNGSIVSNSQVLGDIRHLEREVSREVRSDIQGEGMVETAFLERLTAMYNIPAV